MQAWAHNGNGSRVNAVDALDVFAILLLGALVAFFRHQLGDASLWLIGIFASLLAFIGLSAAFSGRHAIWRVMHDFSPALVIPVLFNTLGPIIDCASPSHWDTTFLRLDALLFDGLPAAWRGVLGRPSWLIDLTYVAYVGYYVAPVVLGALLYRRDPITEFRRMVFTVALTFYTSYVGYFMFPTLGPRAPRPVEALVVGGGAVSQALRLFVDFVERTRTDAFPSGHTAVALICLYFAAQFSAAVFALFVPVVTGIIFSTVYLHYHYVSDVLAGTALACGCVWLGPRLQPLLEPREMMRWFAVHFGMR